MRSRRTALAAVALACLGGFAPALAGTPDQPRADREPIVSSSGESGTPVTTARPGTVQRREPTTRRTIAPGVTYSQFTLVGSRGPKRAFLIAVKWRTKGVRIDYTAQNRVTKTAPILQTLINHHAVAGVNGDFYDIGHTGAPLGLGVDRQRGVLHGRSTGWNSAFYIDAKGRPQIGILPMTAVYQQQSDVHITSLNSPSVPADGVGLYTPAWGTTRGYDVTQGQTRNIRAVLIRNGKVVATAGKLTTGKPITGKLLIGRGKGALALADVKVGQPATVAYSVSGHPQMAITGSNFLVRDGRLTVHDDQSAAPRTAVGIDNETGEVLLLVVDGRTPQSRGMTMVEMADLMIDLGADSALNLDGGGSSTLAALGTGGTLGVQNHPSDGFQRSVADGIEVTYAKP